MVVGKKKSSNDAELRELKKADPTVFRGAYFTRCGAVDGRLPVVLPAQAAMNSQKKKKGSVDFRNKAYLCPEAWCPTSRSVPKKKTRKDKQVKTLEYSCPLSGEKAIVYADAPGRYFAPGEARHVGFIRNYLITTPGQCAPCCFKKPRKGWAECRGPT